MSKKSKLLILCGTLLVLCSLILLLSSEIITEKSQKKTAEILAYLEEVLPSESVGSTDSYSSMQMPSLEVEGKNIIGIVEIPDSDVTLPIESAEKESSFPFLPQRVSGTVYDNSLIVVGKDKKGQLDCLKKADIGHSVTVSDMTGAKFSYIIERIERKKDVNTDILSDGQYDLTLFVQEESTMEYIVVRCKQK